MVSRIAALKAAIAPASGVSQLTTEVTKMPLLHKIGLGATALPALAGVAISVRGAPARNPVGLVRRARGRELVLGGDPDGALCPVLRGEAAAGPRDDRRLRLLPGVRRVTAAVTPSRHRRDYFGSSSNLSSSVFPSFSVMVRLAGLNPSA